MLAGWKNPFTKADSLQNSGPQQQQPRQQQQNRSQSDLDPNNKQQDKEQDPNKRQQNKQPQGDDPISNLESLWQPNMDKDGKPIPDEDHNSGAYLPKMDETKLNAMIEKMNFTDGITQEELDAIKEGGEKAIGAFGNMINRAGRKSFNFAFQASSKLAEQGFSRAQERFMKNIPTHVRDMMVDSSLEASLPIMKNPMFKPMVANVKAQFLKKFPKATPEQITQGLSQYFTKMQEDFATGNKKTEELDAPNKKLRQGAADADFEAWLGDEIGNLGNVGMFQDDKEDNNQQ